jgi:Cys-rich repeat protein
MEPYEVFKIISVVVVWGIPAILILGMIAFAFFAPALIWVGAGAALYQRRKGANLLKRAVSEMACSVDMDCPPGHVCRAGRCVPQT